MEAVKSIRSRTGEHLHDVLSARSEIRVIDGRTAANDTELLAQIGYKQELNRHFSTLQVFGIAFSIMGLLPSISSTIGTALESGTVGFVWGWFTAGWFIMCTGLSITILGSAIPTSGGLYYYTNYYAPAGWGIPLSFLIGCSNSIGLCGGICSISYGFATEVLSAVYISNDGNFDITNGKSYGVFAACVISCAIVCCLTTKHTATVQSVSIVVNVFLIILFIIAVPVGVWKNSSFNSAHYIFGSLENFRTWPSGWSFMLSWMPAIWTIGAFDSVIHCSEEAKSPQKAIPYGIIFSTSICWVFGWFICIVACAAIKDGDTEATLYSKAGNPMAQIIHDSLGKSWSVAFMSLIAVGQYLMSCSIMIAASRQIWAFARDDGLPFHTFVKYVNPKVKVPIRATIFASVFCLVIGLLVLVGPAGSNALFSLGVASNMFAWGTPILMVLLPTGRKRFIPGPFTLGKYGNNTIHTIAVAWIAYCIVMSMFPDSKEVDKNTMNYTVAINMGVWMLAVLYYYVYAYRFYKGPKSNLDESDYEVISGDSVQVIDDVLDEKTD